MLQLKASKPVVVAIQLGAVWAVGAVALPMMWQALLVAALAGAAGLIGVMALVAGVAVLAYLIVVIAATREVSVLGATGGRRVLWALLVTGLGTIGWAAGWAVTDVVGLGVSSNPPVRFLLGGVPFVLVAGLFLRGWQFSATALGLSVVLVGAAVAGLRQESPDEFERRLVVAGVQRETAYAVVIPGYLPTDDRDYGNRLGGSRFRPENPDTVPPDRFISINAYDRVSPGEQMCAQPTAQDSRLTWGSCTVEKDGLVYRHNEIQHGYQVSVGRRYVTVVGTPAVDHDLLRAAALSLHLATAEELGDAQTQTGGYYAATVPGYVGQVTGIPPGMLYTPADRTGSGAQSVSISLEVTYAGSDSICFRTTECTPDGGGLTYVRNEDSHGYVMRREEVNVRIMGGLRVDHALLRQAALNARPATDEELRRAVPPLEAREPLDRLRQWLRTF
ncbi:hypothetical protein ABTX15_24955 [Micromonospora sp. NPDC094482]|uniref:hypothetical protein n=1 Tax=unclassified Micromonospora TaxID=2617518 RepID=UPI00332265EA